MTRRDWLLRSRSAWFALGLLALWQLSIRSGLVSLNYFPAPTDVLSAGIEEFRGGLAWNAIASTIEALLLSWTLAVVIGVVGGSAIGIFLRLQAVTSLSVELLRPLPAVALIPAAVVVFGLSSEVTVLAATFAAVWPVLINTSDAVRLVHPTLREVGLVFGLSPRQLAVKVIVPSILGSIMIGLRVAIGVALAVVVAVEMIAVPEGLGYAIVSAQQALQPATMFFYIVVAGGLGYLLNFVLDRADRLVRPDRRAGPIPSRTKDKELADG